jgi:hypothetical protein
MAKVFIRSFYPFPTGASVPPTGIKLVESAPRWARFETLLKQSLSELGHEITEQTSPPSAADEPRGASIRIYAHKTRRDVDGDLFYKQMHMPELFTVDHLGWGADHSSTKTYPDLSDIDPARAEAFVRSLKAKFLETGCSKLAQPARCELSSLPDDYIFVPTQTPRDYVQVHHSPISVSSFVHLIAQWAEAAEQNVLFKLHPGLYHTSAFDRQVIDAVKRYAATRSRVFCVNANVHDLISRARGVFTINSGVGFESLIHGKPVVTFGDCDYKWVTFAADDKSLSEAREYVFGYTEKHRRQADRFIYHYFFRHAYSIEDPTNTSQRLTEYLGRQLGREYDQPVADQNRIVSIGR